jgi:hypothetical protein
MQVHDVALLRRFVAVPAFPGQHVIRDDRPGRLRHEQFRAFLARPASPPALLPAKLASDPALDAPLLPAMDIIAAAAASMAALRAAKLAVSVVVSASKAVVDADMVVSAAEVVAADVPSVVIEAEAVAVGSAPVALVVAPPAIFAIKSPGPPPFSQSIA